MEWQALGGAERQGGGIMKLFKCVYSCRDYRDRNNYTLSKMEVYIAANNLINAAQLLKDFAIEKENVKSIEELDVQFIGGKA